MRVMGFDGGVAYTVETDAALRAPDRGVIESAPDRVLNLIARVEGETVMLTPVGPQATATVASEEGVLAALMALTNVTVVTDGPEMIEPDTEPMVH